ncbi:MAG: helix-turn-helix domain-containing protein [Bacteroidales bacterium]
MTIPIALYIITSIIISFKISNSRKNHRAYNQEEEILTWSLFTVLTLNLLINKYFNNLIDNRVLIEKFYLIIPAAVITTFNFDIKNKIRIMKYYLVTVLGLIFLYDVGDIVIGLKIYYVFHNIVSGILFSIIIYCLIRFIYTLINENKKFFSVDVLDKIISILYLVLVNVIYYLLFYSMDHPYINNFIYFSPSIMYIFLLLNIYLVYIKPPKVTSEIVKKVKIPPSLSKSLVDISSSNPIHEILNLFERKKLFLNKNLKIEDVSSLLCSNKTYISRIINLYAHKNFRELVNYYRVRESMIIVLSDSDISVPELLSKSGFKNITSFTNAFKYIMSMTPGQWRKKAKSQIHDQNLSKIRECDEVKTSISKS